MNNVYLERFQRNFASYEIVGFILVSFVNFKATLDLLIVIKVELEQGKTKKRLIVLSDFA